MVYKIVKKKNINIRDYKELLAEKLLGLSENTTESCLQGNQHNIVVWKNNSAINIRRACRLYYSNKKRQTNTDQRKFKTIFCPNCSNQSQFCIECFKALYFK